MFKYFLIGLGGTAVVGGGGYMIYNATKSDSENQEAAGTQSPSPPPPNETFIQRTQ